MFLSSLIGDSIILVATIKYQAIRHHKVIVAVVQHLAVSDLLQALFRVFPTATALVEDRWVMGEVMCHVQNYVTMAVTGTTMVLTCAMSTIKLLHVKYPFLARTWSKNFGHKICAALWVVIFIIYSPVLYVKLVLIRDTVHFDFNIYQCNYLHISNNAPSWYRLYYLITYPISSVLSYTVVTVTSVLLLLAARAVRSRNGGAVRLEGLITVLVTVGVYLISSMPAMVILVASLMGTEFAPRIWRTMVFVLYLNIMANFYIYCLTIKSFKEFLKMKALQIIS